MRIEYCNHGIGNNFGDVIELNINLKKYPELYHAVLTHELGHSKKAFSMQDFTHDLGESKVKNWDMIRFMLRHPKSFSQFLPFYWTKKYGFVYDINLFIIYGIMIAVIGIAVYIGLHV